MMGEWTCIKPGNWKVHAARYNFNPRAFIDGGGGAELTLSQWSNLYLPENAVAHRIYIRPKEGWFSAEWPEWQWMALNAAKRYTLDIDLQRVSEIEWEKWIFDSRKFIISTVLGEWKCEEMKEDGQFFFEPANFSTEQQSWDRRTSGKAKKIGLSLHKTISKSMHTLAR